MSNIDEWEAAVDHLTAALKHLKDMRGKSGEQAAKMDVEKAMQAYNKCSERLG